MLSLGVESLQHSLVTSLEDLSSLVSMYPYYIACISCGLHNLNLLSLLKYEFLHSIKIVF